MVSTFTHKEIAYFNVPFEKLIVGKRLEFPLSIYMPLNDNMVVLYTALRTLNDADLAKYRSRGLKTLVCPYEYYPLWLKYIEDETLDDETLNQAREALRNKTMSQEEKKNILTSVGERMLNLLNEIGSGDPGRQRRALAECRGVIDEIVNVALQSHKNRQVYEDLLLMRDNDIAHSSAVSTAAVIFGLVLGFTDPEWLADISLGALLHDLGHSSIDRVLFSKPRLSFSTDEKVSFETHAQAGASALQHLEDDVPDVVRQIISHHHERYDGKGFPQHLAGFQIDERVQIVSLADNVEELMSGQMTGTLMDPLASLKWIKENSDIKESSSVSPEIFEAVFQSVLRTKPTELG